MDDHNKILSKSSTFNNFSSGNNENVSENQRNLHQNTKNFMSPTISTTSKFTPSPKHKIFNEWQSPNSNSTPRKSFPKVPSCTSPQKNTVTSHGEFDGFAAFVPYDPLTNYLSPRPRYLRYRPDRRPGITARGEEKSGSGSDSESESGQSLSDSVESHCCDSSVCDAEVAVCDEDEEEDEYEEENWGVKWELFKGLVVCFCVCLCAVLICCMRSASVTRLEVRRVRFGDGYVMNVSSRVVSLRSVDYGSWEAEFLEKLKYLDYFKQVQVQFKNEDYFELDNVGGDENSVLGSRTEVDEVEIEATRVVSGLSDEGSEMQDVVGSVGVELESRGGGDNGVAVTMTEHKEVDMETPLVGKESSTMEDVVSLVGSEIEIRDSKTKISGELDSAVDNSTDVSVSTTEHERVDIEAPLIAKELSEGPSMEDVVSLLGSEVNIRDSETKFIGVELDSAVQNATEVSDKATEEAIRANSDAGIENSEAVSMGGGPADDQKEDWLQTVVSEPKFIEHRSETVLIDAGDDFVKSELLSLSFREMMIWPVILPMIFLGLLSSLVFKFYRKCKRAASKTRSSNVKLCPSVGNTTNSRAGLPPKAVEKTHHSQLTAPAPLAPPLSINPQDHLETSLNTFIPKVKKLAEFDVGVEFTQSLKSCSVKTDIEQNDETVYATPDVAKRPMRRSSVSGRAVSSQPSSSKLSTSDSYSHGSYISQGTNSVMKDDRHEASKVTPTPRRSTRLRNKGV
ncbi:hypothetical protein vseg_007267 [Gypsophila vaccaria]